MYLKAYRMTFVVTRAQADPLSFLFLPANIIVNEIYGVTGVLVEYSDIQSHRNVMRAMFRNQGFSKNELTCAFKARRNGFWPIDKKQRNPSWEPFEAYSQHIFNFWWNLLLTQFLCLEISSESSKLYIESLGERKF